MTIPIIRRFARRRFSQSGDLGHAQLVAQGLASGFGMAKVLKDKE